MSVTSVPQVLGQNQDIFINSAHASRVQTCNISAGSLPFGALRSNTLTLNPTDGGFMRVYNLTANTTINFVGIPGSYTDMVGTTMYRSTVWYLEVSQGTTYSVSFSNVTWDGGTPPVLLSTATGKNTIMFTSHDGTTINGKLIYTLAS